VDSRKGNGWCRLSVRRVHSGSDGRLSAVLPSPVRQSPESTAIPTVTHCPVTAHTGHIGPSGFGLVFPSSFSRFSRGTCFATAPTARNTLVFPLPVPRLLKTISTAPQLKCQDVQHHCQAIHALRYLLLTDPLGVDAENMSTWDAFTPPGAYFRMLSIHDLFAHFLPWYRSLLRRPLREYFCGYSYSPGSTIGRIRSRVCPFVLRV
jgi:hypothetical protein